MKNKIHFRDFRKNKTNGDPKFWCFDILPALSLVSYTGYFSINLQWLFWTISYERSIYTL